MVKGLLTRCRMLIDGKGAGQPPKPAWREGLRILCGATLGMMPITYLALNAAVPVLVASFGASACLIYVVPCAPFSRPRNVVGGHVLAAATGIVIFQALGSTWYSAALAVGGAVIAMLYTGTLHPPAAATAIIAVLGNQDALYPLVPVAVGAVLLTATGAIYNRLTGAMAQSAGTPKAREEEAGAHRPVVGRRA